MIQGSKLGVFVLYLMAWLPFVATSEEPKAAQAPAKKMNEQRLKGMKDAVADLEKGVLKQKDFNDRPDPPYWKDYLELTKKECGMEWEMVVRGKIDGDYVSGYNDVMLAEIEHRHGRDILSRLLKQAAEKPKSG